MIGVKPGKLDAKVQRLLPGYMTMGETGMGDMGEMEMPRAQEQHPDGRRTRPVRLHHMGGMFTILKVRDTLRATTIRAGTRRRQTRLRSQRRAPISPVMAST